MSDWKKLRELAEAATPGPWRWGDSSKERNGVQEKMMNLYSDAPRSDGDVRIIPIIWLEPSSGWNTLHDNTEFIAAANPTAILALLDENDSLRAEVERLRKDAQAARPETITAIGEAAELDRQLSAALAAKEKACDALDKYGIASQLRTAGAYIVSLEFQLAEEQRLGVTRLQAQIDVNRDRDKLRAEIRGLQKALKDASDDRDRCLAALLERKDGGNG